MSEKMAKVVNEYKDLGAIVSSDLSCISQVASTILRKLTVLLVYLNVLLAFQGRGFFPHCINPR